MSILTISMPEGLAKQLQVCAAEEGVTVDQLIASAPGEKLSALMTLDHLRERAARANWQDFIDFLEGSPDVLRGERQPNRRRPDFGIRRESFAE